MGLWNCQSAVNKADFISAFSLQSTLSILGLTETWIRPEASATPAALSHNFSFSHTPRQVGRGGGTGLLISNNWKYSTHSPLGQRFSTPVLAPPRSAHFACLCCLNTPDSDHQLIRRKFHEWTVFRLTCSLHSVHCSLLPKHDGSNAEWFKFYWQDHKIGGKVSRAKD